MKPTAKPTALRVALALALGLVASVVARPALADVEITLQVKERDKADPKTKGESNQIDAKIVGAPGGLVPEKIELIQTDAKVPTKFKAISIKKYTEGNETMALVLLIEGHKYWTGFTDEVSGEVPGFLKALGPLFDELSVAGPPGSKGMLLVYSDGVQTKQGMEDLKNLTSDKLGAPKDYVNAKRDLVSGLQQAIAELRKVASSRKVLVVIGDGVDTNSEGGAAAIKDIAKTLQKERIETYALHLANNALEPVDSTTAKVLAKENGRTLSGQEEIGPMAKAIAEKINDRIYVTFMGSDKATKQLFTWDTKSHPFAVKVGDDEPAEAGELVLTPPFQFPKPSGTPWWVYLLIPLGLVGLVVAAVKVLGGKAEVIQPLLPIIQAPPVEAAPPKQSAPLKTMMMGMGGDDSYPVVGWVVPLNGPNQFQTFKLQGGATKIGTGGEANIVINDGFMSTVHGTIVASPAGFILQDGGSTNGVYVNERRIDKHELVDNDVFLMGKTNFKFKSIN